MPLGRYKNFDDCVKDQVNDGKSEESANKICGALEKRMSNAAISENLHQKYGLHRLSYQAAQKVMNSPNNQSMDQTGAEPDEGTPQEESNPDEEMEGDGGPTYDDVGADKINVGDPAATYEMDDHAGLDDNPHAQKHEGFDMKMFEATLAADSTPDQLFIVDASLLRSAAKCTEGKYKGEICMAPPDGFPATDGNKVSAKRVRAAITYGVQYGKIATLKKNGLCRYAKAAGVDTKFCGGGTQEKESAVYSASYASNNSNVLLSANYQQQQQQQTEDYQIKPFEQNNKLFIKAFLLDASMNLNEWGVSPITLDRNISSYIGKPICLQENFDHPNSGDDNLTHQLAYQDLFRVGTIVDITKKGTRYDAIAEITDNNAKDAFRLGNLPLYVSPQLYHTGAHKEAQDNMTEWIGTHLAIVDKPAFGVKKANIGSQCTGDSEVCLAQLKKASLVKTHGYGNCGYCNYKVLTSKYVQ